MTKIQGTKVKVEVPINQLSIGREIMNRRRFGGFGRKGSVEYFAL
jgi:hypothetical protein